MAWTLHPVHHRANFIMYSACRIDVARSALVGLASQPYVKSIISRRCGWCSEYIHDPVSSAQDHMLIRIEEI